MGSKVTLTIVWLGGVICAIEGGGPHESTRLSGGQPKWRNHAANKRGWTQLAPYFWRTSSQILGVKGFVPMF